MCEILVNDILDELRDENNRLLNDLCFERNLNTVLENIRNYSLVLINSCKCNQNSDIIEKINEFNGDLEKQKTNCFENTIQTQNAVKSHETDIKRNTTEESTHSDIKRQKLSLNSDISTNICENTETIDTNVCKTQNNFQLKPDRYLSTDITNKTIFGEKLIENNENNCEIIEIKEIKLNSSCGQTNGSTLGSKFKLITELLQQNNGNNAILGNSGRQELVSIRETNDKNNKNISKKTINSGKQRKNAFKCNNSFQTFETNQQKGKQFVENHEKQTKMRLKCNKCLTTFGSAENHSSHICEQNPEQPSDAAQDIHVFKCFANDCTEQFGEYELMSSHMVATHEWFRCHMCTQLLPTLTRMRNHMTLMHRQLSGLYDCGSCGYQTRRKFIFDKHLKTHNKTNEFYCRVSDCAEHFVRELDLEVHRNRQHSDQLERLICSECESRFYSQTDLSRHMSGTHGSQCKVCQFGSFNSSVFAEHLQLFHWYKNAFNCLINGCLLRFNNQKSLEFHQQFSHSNELLFVCDFRDCEQLFRSVEDWRAHLIANPAHLDRPEVANRSSKAPKKLIKDQLIEHMDRHTLKFKFKCNVYNCDKWFRNQYFLYKHKREVHVPNSRAFRCHSLECDNWFATKQQLNAHLKSIHKHIM